MRLICTMSQMTNSPAILIITPTHVRTNEIKMQLRTTKIQDLGATRTDQGTTFVLLADDGSRKFFAVQMDKTNYWLK